MEYGIFPATKAVWVLLLSQTLGLFGSLISMKDLTFPCLIYKFKVYVITVQSELEEKIIKLFQIRIRDSKFGKALVVESTERSGNFILGFKVDPEEKLLTIYKELTSLRTVFLNNPIYGVEYKWKSNTKMDEQKEDILDDLEVAKYQPIRIVVMNWFIKQVIEDPKNEIGNTLSAYLADEGHKMDRLPVYSSELGVAVEAVKDGYSLKKLWEVIPSNW